MSQDYADADNAMDKGDLIFISGEDGFRWKVESRNHLLNCCKDPCFQGTSAMGEVTVPKSAVAILVNFDQQHKDKPDTREKPVAPERQSSRPPKPPRRPTATSKRT